jgi:uncharacterized protein (TIGR03435 family)
VDFISVKSPRENTRPRKEKIGRRDLAHCRRTGPGSSDPERATHEGTTPEILLREAYHVGLGQVSGPSWIQTEYHSVNANLPPGTTSDQYRQMMANLLAERFGLVGRRMPKDLSGYEITVVPGGPKLKPSDPAADFDPQKPHLVIVVDHAERTPTPN